MGWTNPGVASMSPADATRLVDVAVRIERMATSAAGPEDLPDWSYGEPGRKTG